MYIYGPINYTIGCSFWILATRIWPPGFGPSLGQILGPPLVNIVIDEDENNDANREAKKRYWTHEEEERLVITDQFYIL